MANKGKGGWHEGQIDILTEWGVEKKAPRHREAQIRDSLKTTLRQPLVTMPDCKLCGYCCKAHPCGIAPEEVYPIAKHLGISMKQLFDTYLTGDYWVGESYDYLYMTPRRVGDRPGRFDKVDSHWNMPFPVRQCIFLSDKNLCLIHPAKPFTAKRSHCKLPEISYKLRLSEEWKPYIKPQTNSNRDEDRLDYADRIDYDKLERDFGEPEKHLQESVSNKFFERVQSLYIKNRMNLTLQISNPTLSSTNGEFLQKELTIRIRPNNPDYDLNLAHETAHALEHIYGKIGKLDTHFYGGGSTGMGMFLKSVSQLVRDEVEEAVSTELISTDKSYQLYSNNLSEQFARFVAKMMIYPRKTNEVAPNAVETFISNFSELETLERPYMESEEAFMQHHYTGYIDSEAYHKDTIESMSYHKSEEYPLVKKTFKTKKGMIQLRKSKEKLQYVKTDADGEIIRDPITGLATHLSDAEMEAKGLPKTDTTVVAFNDKNEAVGVASDEWGADGIWVVDEYQRLGIGLALLIELRKQFKPERRIGQMTEAGRAMAKAYYRYLSRGNYGKL